MLLLDLERELEPPTPSEDVFSFWATGYQFLERHRADYVRIYDVARVVPVLIVAALAVMLFVWARRLVPEAPDLAGVLAAGLLLSSPNVIAQARLVGTDTGTAFFVVLALVAFRAMLLRSTAVSVLLCGAALGLAQLTKFYALLLYPTLLALVFAWHALSSEERPRLSRLLGCYACAAAISLFVLNAGYLFAEFGTPLSALALESASLKSWQAGFLGSIPLPVPGAFVRALDGQLFEVSSGLRSFLLGESFQGGRWDYYCVLLAIKTPIPFFLTFGVAAVAAILRPRLPRREEVLLLAYPTLLFVWLSFSENRQLGTRALLSAVPFIQLWVAANWVQIWSPRWRVAATGLALATTFAIAVYAYPDYLSYFNFPAGGKQQGYLHASDANIDIGQDLVKLARYLEEVDAGTVQLLYFGSVDPALYGIDYEVPTKYELVPGYVAISVTLYRMGYEVYDHGQLRRVGPVDVSSLGEPVATIGGSIHVYTMPTSGG
ncbi:MAG: phospholipid carrier-dependent glycosyltransferase [Deltaproteobacteria bacterium]|nr:phospholipid carrier-dependent glycosyltransferase [Deltaproteobacteria bacterium]